MGEAPFIHFFNKNYGRRKLKKNHTETPSQFFAGRDASRRTKKIKVKEKFNLDFNSQYEPRWVQKERYRFFDKLKHKPLANLQTRYPTSFVARKSPRHDFDLAAVDHDKRILRHKVVTGGGRLDVPSRQYSKRSIKLAPIARRPEPWVPSGAARARETSNGSNPPSIVRT